METVILTDHWSLVEILEVGQPHRWIHRELWATWPQIIRIPRKLRESSTLFNVANHVQLVGLKKIRILCRSSSPPPAPPTPPKPLLLFLSFVFSKMPCKKDAGSVFFFFWNKGQRFKYSEKIRILLDTVNFTYNPRL